MISKGKQIDMNQVQVRLGKTEIVVNKNGFGALPIQRISDEAAVITAFCSTVWHKGKHAAVFNTMVLIIHRRLITVALALYKCHHSL